MPEIEARRSGDFHSRTYASQRGPCRFELLFAEIFEGQFEAFRNPKRTGLGSIIVDVC